MSMMATMQNIERDSPLKQAIFLRFFQKSVMWDANLKLIKTNKSLHVFFEMMAHFVGRVYFFAVKIWTNVRNCSKNFGHLKIFSARFMNE